MKKYRYLLAFGSNLGNRKENLKAGLEGIRLECEFLRQSRWLETEPLPSALYNTSTHLPYINFVGEFHSDLPPGNLYQHIVTIEDEVGHSRQGKWQPRELDIDILFCAKNECILQCFDALPPLLFSGENGLTVPHREVFKRDFLLDLIEGDLGLSLKMLRRHFKHDRGEDKRGLSRNP